MVQFRTPLSTYRVQFNPGFAFGDAGKALPYLHQLGITDLYASPVMKARPGSAHGYDVTDPLRINPGLGGRQAFEAMVRQLKNRRMGLLLDIAPNHMAASEHNPWWADVLEHGPASPYAAYFDIDWRARASGRHPANRVLLPILDTDPTASLQNQELTLAFESGSFFVHYRGSILPVDPKSHPRVLGLNIDRLERRLGADHAAVRELNRLIKAAQRLPPRTAVGRDAMLRRMRGTSTIRRRLWRLYLEQPEISHFIDDNIRTFNGEKADPGSHEHLRQLLADQAYHLDSWKAAAQQANYRRFFNISDLVGVRVEDPDVFDATHALILRLVNQGKVDGLRIDHIDGLSDPTQYLRRLQGRITAAPSREADHAAFYIIVEKILSGDEELPDEWPACGTTGYDFANALNLVFVVPQGVKALETTYRRLLGGSASFATVVYQAKKLVIARLFEADLVALAYDLDCLAGDTGDAGRVSLPGLREAIAEATACCPVYRTYVRSFELTARDRRYLEATIRAVRRRNPTVEPVSLRLLERVLQLDLPANLAERRKQAWLRFIMRWQQFTGPVMAKGLEDTALYIYNRLTSLNEVGGALSAAPDPVEAFHHANQARLRRWPYTLSATSTHDTKRSEDVRARIDVLSEMPAVWARKANLWTRLNRAKKPLVHGRHVPDANEELLLYQTMIGVWPLCDSQADALNDRLKSFMLKAARESKAHTSWLEPDEAYERGLASFVAAVLDRSSDNAFLTDFVRFQERIAFHGMLNSLAQVVLKVASPGVADFYQGNELWDFSLVDPDNRRPVDLVTRASLLNRLSRGEAADRPALLRELLSHWTDGRVKLYVTWKALVFRREHPELFLEGDYLPLSVSGRRPHSVVAFARRCGDEWGLAVVPRVSAALVPARRFPLGRRTWADDCLLLPDDAPHDWLNVLSGDDLQTGPGGKRVLLSHVFSTLPVALFHGTSGGDHDTAAMTYPALASLARSNRSGEPFSPVGCMARLRLRLPASTVSNSPTAASVTASFSGTFG